MNQLAGFVKSFSLFMLGMATCGCFLVAMLAATGPWRVPAELAFLFVPSGLVLFFWLYGVSFFVTECIKYRER